MITKRTVFLGCATSAIVLAIGCCYGMAAGIQRSLAMRAAAERGDTDRLAWLLRMGVDREQKGWALFFALDQPHPNREVVDLLLQYGAPVNVEDHRGISPLLLALRNADLSTFEALLDRGANPYPRYMAPTLCIAAQLRRRNRVEALLRHRVAPDAAAPWNHKTALIYAAGTGDAAVVRTLLRSGANPNLHDRSGETALSVAMAGKHLEVARLLKSAGARG